MPQNSQKREKLGALQDSAAGTTKDRGENSKKHFCAALKGELGGQRGKFRGGEKEAIVKNCGWGV